MHWTYLCVSNLERICIDKLTAVYLFLLHWDNAKSADISITLFFILPLAVEHNRHNVT